MPTHPSITSTPRRIPQLASPGTSAGARFVFIYGSVPLDAHGSPGKAFCFRVVRYPVGQDSTDRLEFRFRGDLHGFLREDAAAEDEDSDGRNP